MLRRLIAIGALLGILVSPTVAAAQETPRTIVERRAHALNKHDLAAFLDVHAADVAIGVYPDRELGRGREHLEFIFGEVIAAKAVSVEIHRVIEADSFVIVESTMTFRDGSETGVAVYEVRNGRIQSIRFVRDSLRANRVSVDE
ncbi:MAG: nuclear transport factor 2 family protein [Pseudomonadota bacterium]